MPNLIDHLVFRARVTPNSAAIVGLNRQLTYGQLLRLVQQAASKLRRTGIRAGDRVVTRLQDDQRDWILTLALIHEAAITCSLGGAPAKNVRGASWMLTDSKEESLDSLRIIEIDERWFDSARSESHVISRNDFDTPDSPFRIALTSGTTGESRTVVQSLGVVLARAIHSLTHYGPSRCLSLLPMSTAGGFNSMIVGLISGQPFYGISSGNLAELARRSDIESIYGSPIALAGLIQSLERANTRLSGLKMVRYAGSSASRALIANVGTYLCDNIINLYGSTEAGGICTFRPTADSNSEIAGFPYVGVSVSIVDGDGTELPRGTEGRVRLKTPYMVTEYDGNPEATARSFRDGWFYPGDTGVLTPGGFLLLSGRDAELINRGGVKVAPSAIEEFLLEQAGIEDATVFGYENSLGFDDIVAAVKIAAGADIDAIRKAVSGKFGPLMRPSIYFRVNAIPRTPSGKVRKSILRQALTRQRPPRRTRPSVRVLRRSDQFQLQENLPIPFRFAIDERAEIIALQDERNLSRVMQEVHEGTCFDYPVQRSFVGAKQPFRNSASGEQSVPALNFEFSVSLRLHGRD